MFTWAVIDFEYNVLKMHRATIDVPVQGEWWVIVQDGLKWKEGLTYNPNTGHIENG